MSMNITNLHYERSISEKRDLMSIVADDYKEILSQEEYKGLDTLEAILKNLDICVNSTSKRSSSTVDKLLNTSSGNSLIFPVYVERRLNDYLKGNENYLNSVISGVMDIDGDTFKTLTLEWGVTEKGKENKKKVTLTRVAEGADFPTFKIQYSEKSNGVYKYGTSLSYSYETMRRMSIDELNLILRLVSTQMNEDQFNDAVKILKDGNSSDPAIAKTAKVATAKEITAEELTNLVLDYYIETKLVADTIVCGVDLYKKLYTILSDKNSIHELSAIIKAKFPQVKLDSITVLYSDEVDEAKLLVFNRGFGIQKVRERNSNIRENDRNKNNQTQFYVVSENSGFRKIRKEATWLVSLSTS